MASYLLQPLWDLFRVVPWRCQYCGLLNRTSRVIWDTVKYTLICQQCHKMQSYAHIRPFDPTPGNELEAE